MAAGDVVKNVLVRLRVDGAATAKAQIKDIAAQARALGRMDPAIKFKVEGYAGLRALRLQLDALKLAGDKAGMLGLVKNIRALGDTAGSSRLKLASLRLALDALNAAGSAGAGGGGGGGIGRFLTTPGGIIAAIASLPFLAQAAASAITFVLGGALTAIGVYAEKGIRPVQAQLKGLQADVSKTFTNISPAFGEALTTILSAARTFVPQFIRAFGPALDAIAGPLKSLGVMIAGTLAKPEIADSLRALGQAFGGILTALTPAIPGIVTQIADGFTNMFRAVARNPKPFADLLIGLGHLVGLALDVVAWLTQVANFIEQRFIPALFHLGSALTLPFRLGTALAISAPKEMLKFGNAVIAVWHHVSEFFTSWGHDIAAMWTGLWHHMTNVFDGARHDIARILDVLRHDLARIWDIIWNNTIGRIGRGISDAVRWFKGMPGRILDAIKDLPGLMFKAGAEALRGLVHGVESLVGWAKSLLGGWLHDIASAMTAPFGIHLSEPSEATTMIRAGRQIPRGLAAGMRAGLPELARAATLTGHAAMPYGGGYGYGGGGWTELRVTGTQSANWMALVKAIWPSLRLEVRTVGGGGPQSAQRALGVVWR